MVKLFLRIVTAGGVVMLLYLFCARSIMSPSVWNLQLRTSTGVFTRNHTPSAGYPVRVIILSYMRSGTSFLGKLFDENDDAFYVFEPLYFACEYAFPKFIKLRFLNGSERQPGTSCEWLGLDILKSFLFCNVMAIDVSSLTQYWMGHARKTSTFIRCWTHSSNKSCVNDFERVCRQSRIVVLKTIRARLKSVLPLLATVPNLKIIHLVRDPRGVIHSRHLMGEYYHRDLMKTGQEICGNMKRDILTYKAAQSLTSGKLLQIRYEDVAENPLGLARNIYAFLNLTIPDRVIRWIKTNTQAAEDDGMKLGTSRANSSRTASAWRTNASWSFVQNVQSACQDVLNELRYFKCQSDKMLRNLSIALRQV